MSTEKDIRDYLHYYDIDCPVVTPDGEGSILVIYPNAIEVSLNVIKYQQVMKGRKGSGEMHYNYKYEDVKPLLSRLEDITEEDAIELVKLNKWKQYGNHPHNRVYTTHKNPFGQIVVSWGEGLREKNVPASKEVFSPEEFNFLIKKGYWLFGSDWFDEGIIIDRKTLKQ